MTDILQQLLVDSAKGPDGESDARLSDDERRQLREREEIRQAKIANDRLIEELESLKQDREQRKQYAEKIFSCVRLYVLCIIFLLFIQGFHALSFSLTDPVLITLLGTTTANVIGLFAFVAKYLFHR